MLADRFADLTTALIRVFNFVQLWSTVFSCVQLCSTVSAVFHLWSMVFNHVQLEHVFNPVKLEHFLSWLNRMQTGAQRL